MTRDYILFIFGGYLVSFSFFLINIKDFIKFPVYLFDKVKFTSIFTLTSFFVSALLAFRDFLDRIIGFLVLLHYTLYCLSFLLIFYWLYKVLYENYPPTPFKNAYLKGDILDGILINVIIMVCIIPVFIMKQIYKVPDIEFRLISENIDMFSGSEQSKDDTIGDMDISYKLIIVNNTNSSLDVKIDTLFTQSDHRIIEPAFQEYYDERKNMNDCISHYKNNIFIPVNSSGEISILEAEKIFPVLFNYPVPLEIVKAYQVQSRNPNCKIPDITYIPSLRVESKHNVTEDYELYLDDELNLNVFWNVKITIIFGNDNRQIYFLRGTLNHQPAIIDHKGVEKYVATGVVHDNLFADYKYYEDSIFGMKEKTIFGMEERTIYKKYADIGTRPNGLARKRNMTPNCLSIMQEKDYEFQKKYMRHIVSTCSISANSYPNYYGKQIEIIEGYKQECSINE